MGYAYILGSILLTVYGQVVIKWQVGLAGSIPVDAWERLLFFVRFILRPWTVSSLLAAFLAFLCWVAALSRYDLSFCYPFTSLAFVLVLVSSAFFFHEPITALKVVGLALIIAGIIVGSRG